MSKAKTLKPYGMNRRDEIKFIDIYFYVTSLYKFCLMYSSTNHILFSHFCIILYTVTVYSILT